MAAQLLARELLRQDQDHTFLLSSEVVAGLPVVRPHDLMEAVSDARRRFHWGNADLTRDMIRAQPKLVDFIVGQCKKAASALRS